MPDRVTKESFDLQTPDGLRLAGMYRPATAPPQAVVAIVHGLGEHYGRYPEVMRRFCAQGISCYAFDQRGHGRSDGPRGYAPSYDHLLDDLELLLTRIKTDHPELPLFVYGQSMGGNLVSNYLLRRDTADLAGALITSPWLRLRWGGRFGWIILTNIIKLLWPAQAHRDWLNPERLSSVPGVGVHFGTDELVHRRLHPRTFLAMLRAGRYAVERAAAINVPVYIAHGDSDPITCPRASERFAQRSGGDFRLWENMLHETHHEWDYARVIDTMADWILDHTAGRSVSTSTQVIHQRSD
jgi:alpha-beta hydrolase superfamily lysophospholipase